MKNLKYYILIISYLSFGFSARTPFDFELQNEPINIYNEIKVNASPEKTWDKIAIEFANLGDFHPEMEYSYIVNKTLRYGVNALRHCQINDKKYIRENIIRWNEEKKVYTYRLYDSEGLSFMMKQSDFGVKVKNGKTYLYHHLQYKMKTKKQTRKQKNKTEKENLKLLRVYQKEIENDISF